jgi:hypothetical protein
LQNSNNFLNEIDSFQAKKEDSFIESVYKLSFDDLKVTRNQGSETKSKRLCLILNNFETSVSNDENETSTSEINSQHIVRLFENLGFESMTENLNEQTIRQLRKKLIEKNKTEKLACLVIIVLDKSLTNLNVNFLI